MEDPIRELPSVIRNLTMPPNLSVQTQTINTYFTPTCSFSHPFVLLPSFLNPFPSRLALIEIYRFYKFLSPRIVLRITSLAIDKGPLTPRTDLEKRTGSEEEEENIQVAYVRCEQDFQYWFSPFSIIKVELVAQFTLVEMEEPEDEYSSWSVEGTLKQGDGTRAVRDEPESREAIDDGIESMTGSEATTVLRNEAQPSGTAVETKARRKLWYIKEQKDLYQDDQFIAYLPSLIPCAPAFLRMFQRIAAFFTVILGMIVYAGSNLVSTFFGALSGARYRSVAERELHRKPVHLKNPLNSNFQDPHHSLDKTKPGPGVKENQSQDKKGVEKVKKCLAKEARLQPGQARLI